MAITGQAEFFMCNCEVPARGSTGAFLPEDGIRVAAAKEGRGKKKCANGSENRRKAVVASGKNPFGALGNRWRDLTSGMSDVMFHVQRGRHP